MLFTIIKEITYKNQIDLYLKECNKFNYKYFLVISNKKPYLHIVINKGSNTYLNKMHYILNK